MISLQEGVFWLQSRTARLGGELVPVPQAAGRVLVEALAAQEGVRVCAIDGHAVAANQTQGASEYAPLPLRLAAVTAGEALPDWADAVLPLHWADGGCALGVVAPGDGVSAPDALAIAAGTVLGPMHLAVLARRGMREVKIVQRPRVRLRVAGPKHGEDALTGMLTTWIERVGGILAADADLVLHAGRSGAGPDDGGVAAFENLFAHGIRLRPGETTAMGMIEGSPALLLPGDPAACAIVFALMAAPVLRSMAGRAPPVPFEAVLTRKISAGLGEMLAVPVMVRDGTAMPVATVLSALAGADGLVLVPEASEGYPAGSIVAISPLP